MTGSEAVVSLNGVLNIFWRRRRIVLFGTLLGLLVGVAYGLVTAPLFRARAQVRPGITAYTEQGGPVREWRLKDVVRWFRLALYWDAMRENPPFDQREDVPVIRAEFIAAGPQNLQGGQVVLLETLAEDPAEAMGILDTAIAAFNRDALADTVGNDLHLTRGGIEVRIAKLRGDIEHLEAERRRAELAIKVRRSERALVDADARRIDFELAQLDSLDALRRRGIAAAQSEERRVAGLLEEAENTLHALLDRRGDGASRESGGVAAVLPAAEMLASVQHMRSFLFRARAHADSLEQRIVESRVQRRKFELKRDSELAMRRVEIDNAIADLELKQELDLPYQVAQLEQNIASERVQLTQLAPLERIGSITVSDRPVRPRRLRAAAILTVLAFFGSLFLALLVEYYRRNRDAIIRSAPMA